MHYEELVAECLVFMTDPSRRPNTMQRPIANFLNRQISRKGFLSLIIQLFLFIKKKLYGLAAQDTSFSTSVTLGVLHIVTFCGKVFLGERELCDILYEYICIWRSVRLISIIWPYVIWCLA